MFDTNSAQGGRALARLVDEKVMWLTTVGPSGQPQTSPVWFLYAGGEFLVYSRPDRPKLRNIGGNPRVAGNLDGNGEGGDIVTMEGRAHIDPEASPSNLVAAYQEKYAEMITRHGWTPEQFATDYPVAIRITPLRGRTW